MLSKRLGQVSLSSTWYSSCNRWVASQKVSVVMHIHIRCRVLSQLFWLYMLHFILHDDIIFNLRSLQLYADLSIFTCRITLHIRDAGKERSRGEFTSTAVGSVIFAHVLGRIGLEDQPTRMETFDWWSQIIHRLVVAVPLYKYLLTCTCIPDLCLPRGDYIKPLEGNATRGSFRVDGRVSWRSA